MRVLTVLFVHLVATVAKLIGPGDARAAIAESLLIAEAYIIYLQRLDW